MAKYIDSEKLKELIDEKWKELANNDLKVGGRGTWDTEINTYLSVLTLIDSLQQDQSNNSLEEKAKAYDEALERARKMLNMILDNELLGFPDQIREIFPQLCENEEERIRKELLAVIDDLVLPNEQKARFNAYLEKQQEQNPINHNFTTWHIQTWGADTPHYLVSAETKEQAWAMVKDAWERKFKTTVVGGRTSYFFGTEIYVHQDIVDLIEIKGLTTQTSLIVDLNEN